MLQANPSASAFYFLFMNMSEIRGDTSKEQICGNLCQLPFWGRRQGHQSALPLTMNTAEPIHSYLTRRLTNIKSQNRGLDPIRNLCVTGSSLQPRHQKAPALSLYLRYNGGLGLGGDSHGPRTEFRKLNRLPSSSGSSRGRLVSRHDNLSHDVLHETRTRSSRGLSLRVCCDSW